jgi:hypothetical protein
VARRANLVDLALSLPDLARREATMARARLNPNGPPLTATGRWRRYRDRKRGLGVPDAPHASLASLTPADELEVPRLSNSDVGRPCKGLPRETHQRPPLARPTGPVTGV